MENLEEQIKLAQESVRNYNLKIKYNITPDQYNKLFILQNGVCAICHKPQSGKRKSLSVDHDHKTFKIRGLLCNRCNVGIGFLKENIEILESAINYLKNNVEIIELNIKNFNILSHETCPQCGNPGVLTIDKICKSCLRKNGFKYCSECNIKKILYLDFYQGRSECIECSPNKVISNIYDQCTICKKYHSKVQNCKKPNKFDLSRCRRCKEMKPDFNFFSKQICKKCHDQN